MVQFRSRDGDADAARGGVPDLRTGKVLPSNHSAEPPQIRHAEAIGRYCFDEAEFRLNDQLTVAIDQAGFAGDVDLREAELVVADDAILRLDDLASFLVDEAVETATTNSGPALRKLADPIVARRDGDTAGGPDRTAKAARKHARRQRKS